MTDSSEQPPSIETIQRRFVVLAATVAALLRLPAYFSVRHLTFDDGVFASSVLAMRDGGIPFKEVFSSQGPLFLPLAYLFDFLGLRTIDSPRVLAIVSGVVLTIFVFLALIRMTKPIEALYGALIVAASGCIMWVTGPLAADGPALAFAAIAFWMTLIHLERPRLSSAALIGLSVGASLASKSMHLPLIAVVAVVLATPTINDLRARRFNIRTLADPVVSGVLTVGVYLVASIPFGLSNVWDQAFSYRAEISDVRDPLGNLRKIISTLWDRDLVLWLLVVVTLGWAILRRTHSGSSADDRSGTATGPLDEPKVDSEAMPWRPSHQVLCGAWLALTVAWLTFGVNPMWRAHVSAVVLPAAFVLALNAPPRRWLAVLTVACVPLVLIQLDGLLVPGDYSGSERRVVELLRELPQGAWVISDEPGLVWRAGRRTTDNLVDPSMLRVQSGRYDEDDVVRDAADNRVCAAVVRSDDRFGHFPGLSRRLESIGYVVVDVSRSAGGDDQRVYVRADCSPPG